VVSTWSRCVGFYRCRNWTLESSKEMNWKTTAAGIGAIMVAVGGAIKALFDGDPTTNIDLAATIAAVTVGFGLIAAKDADKKKSE
jgi:hypothetical protein